MKKYKLKDLESFEIIDGILQCPSGEWCSFEGIGEYIGNYPFKKFTGCGTRLGSTTYIFNLKKGIYIRCGCFLGTVPEFRKRVLEKKGDPTYLKVLDAML